LKRLLFIFYNKILKNFFKIIKIPLFFIILNFYKLYLWLKKRFSFLGLTSGRILFPFTNQYLVYLVIFLITLFIIINNEVYAITSEPVKEGNILSSLVSESEEEGEVIFEEEFFSSRIASRSYLDQEAALRVTPEIEKEELEEPPIITQGGTALIKPNLPTMIGGKTRDKVEYYLVEAGDTITSIAAKFGISIDTILWENKLGPFDYIRPGQKLTILPISGVSHKVKKGETLEKIAKKYNVEPEEIIEFNKLIDASDVAVDQVLIIPGGRIIYSIPPPRTRLASLKDILTAPQIKAGFEMIWPTITKRISQYFSWRHRGLDINGEFGDPIWAVADGIVEKALCVQRGYGCHIIIDHGGGKKTLYAHAQKLLVQAGQAVKKGQLIAEEGSTGRSTGSHLHFEIWIGSQKVNPFSYVR